MLLTTASRARKSAKSRFRCSRAADSRDQPSASGAPLEKAGFKIIRQGKHIVMSDGVRQVTVPRHNPIQAYTMGGIVQDAGLTPEEFRKLL